jgi:hypothetical protein
LVEPTPRKEERRVKSPISLPPGLRPDEKNKKFWFDLVRFGSISPRLAIWGMKKWVKGPTDEREAIGTIQGRRKATLVVMA